MKTRDIILDFTSIIDIIMIILFWFIIQSQNSVEDAQKDSNKAKDDANKIVSEYNAMKEDLEKEWEDAHNANSHSAENQQVLNEFEKGIYLKYDLIYNSDNSWSLIVSQKNQTLFSVNLNDNNDLKDTIIENLTDNNINDSDVIIGIFTFNGTEEDSYEYVIEIKSALNSISKDYFKNMYIADNNISRIED